MPPIHVSTGSKVTAAVSAGKEQVLARNAGVNKEETDASVDGGLVEMTSVSVVDEKSSAHVVEDDGHSGWSEVKSSKSPRRKKTNSADSVENQQVMNERC